MRSDSNDSDKNNNRQECLLHFFCFVYTVANFSGNVMFCFGVPTNFDCNSLNGNLEITIWFGFI